MKAEHTKKKRSEIEALRAKNAGRREKRHEREHYHLPNDLHHHGYSFCLSLYTLKYKAPKNRGGDLVCAGSCWLVTCKKCIQILTQVACSG